MNESRDDQVSEADEVLLDVLTERVLAGIAPTAKEILTRPRPATWRPSGRNWTPKKVSFRLKQYGIEPPKKSNGERPYRHVTVKMLRKIEQRYGIDLGLPPEATTPEATSLIATDVTAPMPEATPARDERDDECPSTGDGQGDEQPVDEVPEVEEVASCVIRPGYRRLVTARATCLECVNGDATELSACPNVQCPGYSRCRRRRRDAVRGGEPAWTFNPENERSVSMRELDVPQKYKTMYDRAMAGRSMKAAIRAHCLYCLGWDPVGVRECTAPWCPLFAYRLPRSSRADLQDALVGTPEVGVAAAGIDDPM